MREFKTADQKELKQSTRICGLIFATLLILFGIFGHSLYSGVIGAILIAALIMVKRVVVNEEGIVTTYDCFFFKRKEVWSWEEIKEIHKQLSPNKKEMALHFSKEVMVKRLIFPMDVYEKVLDLAREMKPGIYIADVDW